MATLYYLYNMHENLNVDTYIALTVVVRVLVLASMYNIDGLKQHDSFLLLKTHTSFLEQLSFDPINRQAQHINNHLLAVMQTIM